MAAPYASIYVSGQFLAHAQIGTAFYMVYLPVVFL